MSGEKQIQDLYNFARDQHSDTEVSKSYRVYLLTEELAKPQYTKINIPVKHIREILRLLISDI